MMKQRKQHSSIPSSTTCSVSFIDVVHTSPERMDKKHHHNHDSDNRINEDYDDGTDSRTVTIKNNYRKRMSDDGVDNPFRPGGLLSQEADIIVQLIKEGKQLTLQSIQSMPELSRSSNLIMVPNERNKLLQQENGDHDLVDGDSSSRTVTLNNNSVVGGTTKLKSKSLQRNGIQVMSPVIEERPMTKSSSCNDGNLNSSGHSSGRNNNLSHTNGTVVSPGADAISQSKKQRKKEKKMKKKEMSESKKLNGNNNQQQQQLTKSDSTSSSTSSSNSTANQINSIPSSGVTSPFYHEIKLPQQQLKEGDTSEVKKAVIVTSPSVELVKLKKGRHCCIVQ